MNSRKIKIVIAVVAAIVILVGVLLATTCSGKGEQGGEKTKKVESTKEKGTTTKADETSDLKSESSDDYSESTKGETTSDSADKEDETTSALNGEEATGDSKETTTKVADENSTTKTTTTQQTTTQQTAAQKETTTASGGIGDNTVSTGDMRNITTAQVVREMGIGINLGNTFESCGTWINKSSVTNFETAWGSPKITKAMIQGMAAEGFGVLRIPVAWSNMMDSNYNIDASYIARVKEVVDWTLDSGMYAIINIHYDSGWWENFPTDKENCMKKYKAIWTQLSAAFGDYGDKLMFESLNEEGCWDSVWNRYGGTSGKSEAYGLLNEINQTFVDVVRSSGGNNTYRHLLIAGYATDITLTCDSYFKMPSDPQGRCAVSVHYYTPSTYTILEADADWGKAKTQWGSDSDVAELKKYMKMMYDNFVGKGIPVIVGEFGVPAMSNKSKDNAVLYMKSVAEVAYDYGMCPILWDTTSNYSYYNRYTCSMSEFEALKEAFADILR